MKAAFALGRLIFGGFFLYNGIHHFMDRKSLSQYAGAKNIPQPELAVTLSGLALILGGASVVSGVRPKMGAALLVGFLASVSPTMHDFWHASDATERMNQMVQFSKNMALLGAALALMGVDEPWPVSAAEL